ncbi:MAG: hypothetical protein AAFR84_17330 [Pseudomonadota bacterium]
MKLFRGILLCFSTLMAPSVSASELQPITGAAVDGASETYPLERCAALHFSMLSYFGESTFDAEHVARVKGFVSSLIAMSVVARKTKTGASMGLVQEAVHSDVFAISQLYEARFKENYASTGQAFGSDPLIKADLSLCEGIAREMG